MTSKCEELYHVIIERLKQIVLGATAREMNPRFVVSDYELAILRALAHSFPNAQVSGCWFHFGQVSFDFWFHFFFETI